MLVDIQFSPTVLLFVIYCNFCASSVLTLWNSAFIGLLPNIVFLHWEAAGFLECEEPCPPCCWRSRIHMDGQVWFWKDENWAGMLYCICTLYFSLHSKFHHFTFLYTMLQLTKYRRSCCQMVTFKGTSMLQKMVPQCRVIKPDYESEDAE